MRPAHGAPIRGSTSVLLSLLILLLAACGAPTTSPRSAEQSPDGDSSAAPSAGAPSTTFSFDSADPVVSREMTGVEAAFINPGAVFEHEGTFHMFANLFTGFPGVSQISYLTSPDGLAWTLAQPEPVFVTEDIEFAATGAHVSAGFVTDDGTWVLIFESLTTLDPWRLGRATAPGPVGPWTVDPDPILEPGDEGDPDAGGLSWPTVVRTDAGYAMYYTARPEPRGDGHIAMATSPDGATWTKAAAPVLEAAAAWEDGSLDRPRVTVTPDGYAMVYSGRDLTDRGIAYSSDGIAWTRDGDEPVITIEDFPVDGRCWDATLLHRDGSLHYILEIGSGSVSGGGTELYLATAPLP